MKKLGYGTIVCLLLVIATLAAETVAAQEQALVIGIFPRRDVQTTTKLFTPLTEYLSSQLGREVKLETRLDFSAFWKEVEAGTFDIIHYNQYHYIKAHKHLGHVAIARNEEMGSSMIGGAIFVRKDSGFTSVGDLKGKKIVFGGGKGAMQSYIIATHLLRQGGLGEGDYIEDFSRNPPNAIKAVFHKQAAAGGAGDVVVQLPIVKKNINTDEVKMLTQSERHPHLPWAVKGDMEEGLREKIRSILTSLKDTPEGRAVLKNAKLEGLVASSDSDFDMHRKIVKEVKDESY